MGALREAIAMQEWLDKVGQNDYELPKGYPANPEEFFDLAAKPYFVVSKSEID